ncbi:MAG: efflux RND transporter periplasmic adaptor subunit [Solidesulfovibrio sp.]
MKPVVTLLTACCLLAGAVSGFSQEKAPATPGGQASFRPAEITFSGKIYSPVKLSVFMPYNATILTLSVPTGQKVKRGDVLATFEVPLETRMDEKTKLSTASIKDLEHRLATTEKEIDKLTNKSKELHAMSQQNMASTQGLAMNAKEIEVYRKEKVAVSERLALSREMLAGQVELADERFGKSVSAGVPKEGSIKAKSDGYVLWINPVLRAGVKLPPGTELFQVGSLNPMILRAQVHEIEALKLKEGMKAEVTFDSLPGKKFVASVSRLPWAPIPSDLQQPSYYDIELTIPNPDLELKEGLKGQITIAP